MQPQNSETNSEHQVGQEQQPQVPQQERVPILPSPEGGIESGAERKEQTAEAHAAVADAAAQGAPVVPVPPPVDDAQPVSASGPLVAADEDVIEKEWVDKAKQIIASTKDDPYQRSTQVNQLQHDYLKKRYGKELGAAE